MAGSLEFRIDRLSTELVEFDPRCYSIEACAEFVEKFARLEKMLAVQRVRAADRASKDGAHRKRGFADASDWLAATGGSTTREARSALGTVAVMAALSETHDAVVAGEVSLSQAAVIVETVADAPDAEGALVDAARSGSLGFVRDQARKRRLAAADVDALHERRHARRSLEHWLDKDGMVCGRFELPPEVGVPFVNRLEREADRKWRKARREGVELSNAACRADALVALTKGGRSGQSRTELVLVADIKAYRRGHAHKGELAHAVGGGPLPISVIRDLSEDAFLEVVLHDGVAIHTVKHFGRHVPAELRTALELGPLPELDGVECVELGCHRKYGLELDHIDPVANGGPTSAENLEFRCRSDHAQKTKRDRAAGLLGGKRAPP